ncbi:MAG: phytanoyl-CoA dioxygenase family protein [Reyranella sp.]|nr:phytanoyl-CoA dioxygenase family protein [Reyranella sp.]
MNEKAATLVRIDCRGISGDDPGTSDQIRLASDCLVKNGYAILDHVIAEDKVAALKAEFDARYAAYLEDRELDDTLKTGNRRFMIPIDFSGGFADPSVYANPFVVAVVRAALDQDAILESYGAIVSLPGAQAQHIHRDNPLLFGAGIAPLLPAHALNFALPLIDMNDEHGTTALWPGSHRWLEHDKTAPSQAPEIPVGSCVLWDFRTFHSGTANRSETHRPMVYATFARRWYRDPGNFYKTAQRRLSFEPAFLRSVPKGRRKLFWHVDPSLAAEDGPEA